MKKNDITKKSVLKGLDECLYKLRNYDEQSIMPLLYVLSAHHAGHLVSIVSNIEGNIFASERRHIQNIEGVDGYEGEILKGIRSSVNEAYFSGQPAEIIYDFYSQFNEYINDYYTDIKEHVMEYFSNKMGKASSVCPTPKELAILMSTLLANLNPKVVYDPCAGLCSFFMTDELSDVHPFGQEISPFVKAVADFRTDAVEMGSWCTCEDCIESWYESSGCDAIISDLPMGMRLRISLSDGGHVFSMENYVISRFIGSNYYNKAVILVSLNTLYGADNQQLRQRLCESNYVDKVITLPAGILLLTGIPSAIIVLNKNKKDDKVTFMNADDCISKSIGHLKVLDYKKILSRLSNEKENLLSDNRIVFAGLDEIRNSNFRIDPRFYMKEDIEILPGQTLVKFTDVVTRIKGTSTFEEKRGNVLISQNLNDNIANLRKDSISEDFDLTSKQNLLKVTCECIIFNNEASKFFIKRDKSPLFVSRSLNCFSIKDAEAYDVDYFVYAVVSSERFRKYAMRGCVLSKVDFNALMVPVYQNIESQRNIVKRQYREESSRLKVKLDELAILGGESSDLLHNLGITFTKISAGIGSLRATNTNDTLDALNDNVKFALRQINSTGADFSKVKPELEKVVLYDVISDYVKAWGNFGYNSFELNIDNSHLPSDTKVELDKDLLFTMLDCILINAHQHGFNKHKRPDNQVTIELKGVFIDNDDYAMISVSNNGNPLPDGFTLEDFAERGKVGINSSQDGLGGYHVKTIAKLLNGKLSIDSNNQWLSFNVLLPIYLTSDNSKFDNYECESI